MALSQEAAIRKDMNTKTPAMQHRHFAFIARVIADLPDPAERERVARHFACDLHGANPNFNRDRFLYACGATP